ncbi:hypothetical protein TNCT_333311 [Trichonephila clavata]|uniref:Uncharacterized protein n=1 Tax=Trichonephila clavata TaxID=2740835 RepID=A0A8X6G9Z6_TRICU|nr:hypothetical protein TNCT_333311 [Trichonephila clavata]
MGLALLFRGAMHQITGFLVRQTSPTQQIGFGDGTTLLCLFCKDVSIYWVLVPDVHLFRGRLFQRQQTRHIHVHEFCIPQARPSSRLPFRHEDIRNQSMSPDDHIQLIHRQHGLVLLVGDEMNYQRSLALAQDVDSMNIHNLPPCFLKDDNSCWLECQNMVQTGFTVSNDGFQTIRCDAFH